MKVVTHDGKFHADEIFAIALLKHVFNEDIDIERTRTISDSMLNDRNVWVLDVGGVYSPNLRNFDHHQDSNMPSTNVLVLNYLKELSFIKDDIYSELRGPYIEISKMDNNGSVNTTGFQVNSFFSKLNHIKDGFEVALMMAGYFIDSCKESVNVAVDSRKIWDDGDNYIVNKEKAFKVCKSFPHHWKRFGEYPMLICPHQTMPHKWQLISSDAIKYPIVDNQKEVFIHQSRFMAVYMDKSDAIAAAIKSFTNSITK